MNLKELIKSRMEALQPQGYVRDYFKERVGKALTERDITKLNEAHPGFNFRLNRNYGMAHIEWGKYTQSGGREGGSLLVAYAERNLVIDFAFLIEHNGRFFSALDARNIKRQHLLSDPALMADFEKRAASYLESKAITQKRRESLDELLEDFDGPFEPDKYTIIDKLLGEGNDK